MKTINYKHRLASLMKTWYFNTTEYIPFNREVTKDYIHEASFYIPYLYELRDAFLAQLFEIYPTIAPFLTKGLDKVEEKFGPGSVIRGNKFRGILNTIEVRDYFKCAMDEIILEALGCKGPSIEEIMSTSGFKDVEQFKNHNVTLLNETEYHTRKLRRDIPLDYNAEHTVKTKTFIEENLGIKLDSDEN